jgi:DNA-binding MarR family transcriptional regulator
LSYEPPQNVSAPDGDPPTDPVDRARRIVAVRRLRDQVFGKDLFGEPSWDILLTLFVANEEGRNICVKNLCADAAVPSTTALRWMMTLLERGLLVRVGDSADGRRSYIHISPGALETMRDLLGRTI